MSITGSTGNVSIISDGEGMLQIDCGLPYKKVNALCSYKLYQCRDAIVTHRHSDHFKYASDFMRYGMNVWATSETWTNGYTIGPKTNCKIFKQLEQFKIGTFLIKAFPVAHTNIDGSPCENSGFLIYSVVTKEKLLWITDANYIENHFPPVDYIAIECNYLDIEDYAKELAYINLYVEKRRLQSHLSLSKCIQFLKAQDLSKIKWVKVLHISKSQGKIEDELKKQLSNTFPNVNFII